MDSYKKKAVLYARKSNQAEDKQVQSIDDQINAMCKIAKDEGIEIADILKESKSAKAPGTRPVFSKMFRTTSAVFSSMASMPFLSL